MDERTHGPIAAHDLRYQKNGQIVLRQEGDRYIHVANVLRSNPNAAADAEFIVQAWNNYESLLKALRDLDDDVLYAHDATDCECGEFLEEGTCPHARAAAAIAKAEATP